MSPKYKIGDIVVLTSATYSEYNGEYIVHAVMRDGDRYQGHIVECIDNSSYHYDLGFKTHKFPTSFSVWREGCLRKKQDPSEFSFNELMADLNSNISNPAAIN